MAMLEFCTSFVAVALSMSTGKKATQVARQVVGVGSSAFVYGAWGTGCGFVAALKDLGCSLAQMGWFL